MDKFTFENKINKTLHSLPGSIPESYTYQLRVKKKFEGLNIIDFYLNTVAHSSASIWEEKIQSANLKVNDNAITKDYIVKAGDVTTHTSLPKTEPTVNTKIKLINANDDFWVINKPSPLPVHASGRFIRNTLITFLELTFPNEEFKMVHRIDANTTGLIVIAKNKATAQKLSRQFQKKEVEKEYIALVEGFLDKKLTSIDSKIGKTTQIGGARKIDKNGLYAHTSIKIIEHRKDTSLIKVIPHTGRTNQIRLHLAEIGHPIVGDLGYKNSDYFNYHPFTYPNDSLFLHAYQLKFHHPITKEFISFKAPIPSKFKEDGKGKSLPTPSKGWAT